MSVQDSCSRDRSHLAEMVDLLELVRSALLLIGIFLPITFARRRAAPRLTPDQPPQQTSAYRIQDFIDFHWQFDGSTREDYLAEI